MLCISTLGVNNDIEIQLTTLYYFSHNKEFMRSSYFHDCFICLKIMNKMFTVHFLYSESCSVFLLCSVGKLIPGFISHVNNHINNLNLTGYKM